MSPLVEFGAFALLLAGPMRLTLLGNQKLTRVPRAAMLLWQACLAALLISLVDIYVALVHLVAPAVAARRHLTDFSAVVRGPHETHLLSPSQLYLITVGAMVLTAAVGAMAVRLMGQRRTVARQQLLLGLVGQTSVDADIVVVEHARPMAYGVPGSPRQVVLSSGAFGMLSATERQAVVTHELAHLRGRHHLFLLPFESAARLFPNSRAISRVYEHVAGLTEMAADDAAISVVGAVALASAICRMGSGTGDDAALHRPTLSSVTRVNRALRPRPRAAARSIATSLTAIGILVLPLYGVFTAIGSR